MNLSIIASNLEVALGIANISMSPMVSFFLLAEPATIAVSTSGKDRIIFSMFLISGKT